jgi:DNA uptake protein ComE-like DNA-binding protein
MDWKPHERDTDMKPNHTITRHLLLIVTLALSIPACGSTTPSNTTSNPPAAPATGQTTDQTTASTTKLNLNEVTEDQLLNTIPNFGNRMVHEFFEYRPYVSIQQFRREIGKYVDAAQVAEYEKYVYVPIDVNHADMETLKQLPGVDDAIAITLIAARPYETNADFLQALSLKVTPEQVAAAQPYLASQ